MRPSPSSSRTNLTIYGEVLTKPLYNYPVCVCVCDEVWRYERVQGMRRVEHVLSRGLGCLRTSLTPRLPLSLPPKKIARKPRNYADSVFLFIYSVDMGKEV